MIKYLYHYPLLVVIGMAFLTGCARNPVTGKRQLVLMSEKQEIRMGQQADPEIIAFFGRYENPELQEFITEKGKEMAAVSHRPKLDYEFKIVDSPVINAFAVPGGFVYFTRGIMAHFNNEAEFAGVLGHEIGHVTARHSVIQQRNAMLGQLGMIAGVVLIPELSQFMEPLSQGVQLAMLSFGRGAERQSDKLGVEYSTRIGYDAAEMAGFFRTLERQEEKGGGSPLPEFLSTHPSPADRNVTVAQLAKEWQEKLNEGEFAVNRESYLKIIDGLTYGEDPKQGFVENSTFFHPELKFQFPIPADWNYQNTPQQVQMAPKNGEAVMMLTLAQGNSLKEIANKFIEQNQLDLISTKEETNHGLKALSLVAEQKQDNATIRLQAYFIQQGEYFYRIMGISKSSNFENYHPRFLNTMQNFKELKDTDKLNRKPERVRIKTLSKNMTLQQALKAYNIPDDRLEELAILNGMALDASLNGGTMIKVVEK
ncbi:M48 family metalloprotease [Pleomorphovibrio marinus]|uniref:M48 family metalloprotease n=1 Tax=Pleomorphovibrio marinus TaxID=2164132 RepID=UPI000E0B9D03|nr:M48 family metalloprotease [Pleomorphovibrio marinus]